jgi:PAS domain S-box-containing protein
MIPTLTSRLSFARAVRVARLAAAATGLVGLVALGAWALGFRGPARALQDVLAVHPNGAVALVAGALAIFCLQPQRAPAIQWIGAWLAAAVAAIGLSTVSQDLLGYDAGIDRLLWPGQGSPLTALAGDRMPPAMSTALVLLGGALLLGRSRWRATHGWSEWVSLSVFAGAMVVLVGHLFGVPVVASLGGAVPVGVTAAVALAFFAVGVLFTSPVLGIARRFTEDSAGGLALRRLVPAALVVPVLLGLATQLLARDGRVGGEAVLAVFSVAVALMFMTVVLWTDAAMRTIEARRSEAEKRFRRTFENATVGIAHVAVDGRWLRVNQRLCELVGRTRAELEELSFGDLVHPQDRDRHEEQEAGLRSGEITSAQGVERLLDSAGATVWVEVRASPQFDELGELEYLIYVLLDVTERVHAQAERERLYREAVEARAEAERANRVKDEFFALVSHELRAPLNTLSSWLSVLRGATDAELRSRALRTLERAVRVQARLINDLLDASRIQSGKLELASDLFDARAATATTVDSVLPAASAKSVRLQARLGAEALVLRGDEERFEQVVRNLIDNALKFTSEGGRIEVELGRRDGELVLEVRDDGAGIEADALPHVFERFRQGRRGGGYGGLGLGLSIVKHIVERHGGAVEVESDGPGRGTTFRIALPLADRELAAVHAGAVARAARAALRADGEALSLELDLHGITVLVADEDRASLDAIELLLHRAGARVRTATRVEEALRALAEQRPDAVLSSVYLPGGGGTELAEDVRAREAAGEARVFALAMTSETGHATRERLLAAGFDEVLAEPIDPEKLFARLRAGVRDGAGGGREAGRLRLLVVEDDAAALEATCALLADGSRDVLSARSGGEALRVARERVPDVLITDYRLPDMTGAELAVALARESGGRTRALALTGHSRADLGSDAEAFFQVLRKPLAIAELEAVLRREPR